ncbi:MAG: YidC/Oxa1 family membrane protein insertase [Eubacteriales bacterium]|nr:YidC/Oxa1 family membrane protein insertase [Eubacteriales bacterium]
MLSMNFSSFWDIFAIPFGYVMQFFNKISGGHYLISLFLFALAIKLITLPFGIKQQKTQIKGAMLRPKMMMIEKKYAGRNDRVTQQKKQQEMMELQQKEGYSPLSGCLPLLIQFPILIALYRIIRMPLKYCVGLADEVVRKLYNALYPDHVVEAFKKIPDAAHIEMIGQLKEQPDVLEEIAGIGVEKLPNYNIFGQINLGLRPAFNVAEKLDGNKWNLFLLIIPFLCGGLALLTTWLSRKLNDNGLNQQMAQQQKTSMFLMNITMPLLQLWIAFGVSGAVGVYWVYTSILGIIQILVLAKVMPLPKYTDEEIRMMQREMKKNGGPGQRTITGTSVDENGKPKSLHYVDDDDEY